MANVDDIDQEMELSENPSVEEYAKYLAKDGLPVVERTVIDPETGEELIFQANYENELDGLIDDYFDPFYDQKTGKYLD